MTAASQDEVIGEAKDVSSFQVAPSSRPPSPPSLQDTHEHDAQFGDKTPCARITYKRASKGREKGEAQARRQQPGDVKLRARSTAAAARSVP
jgi:hypothetical protein